jgi:hypothetical protein
VSDFDWSLGVEEDDTIDKPTPVSERGAKLAETNRLNVQSQAPEEDDQGDAHDDAADDSGDAAEQRDASEVGGGDAAGEDEGDSGDDGGSDALILGKFKTQGELEKAYREAEQRLGQQSNEVGQLRRDLDEQKGAISAMQSSSNAPQITDDLVSQVDELASENPQGAAMWALENQPLLYNRVMQIWAGTDPLGAGRFENALMRDQMQQEMTEQFEKKYGSTVSTVTEQTQASQFDTAWRAVATKVPDLADRADAMMEAAAAAPELAAALQSGDVASKERLIENLYWLAKGKQADHLAAAATDLGRQQQKDASARKRGASVASGSSAQARGEKTNIESWKEQFLEAPSTSIADNLREKR